MELNQLTAMVPSTTPIRIYNESNPYEPLVWLIYSDSLNRGNSDLLKRSISTVGSSVHEGLAYLIVWLR